MEILALLRMSGALLVVLAMLGVAAWAVRRYDLRLPGRIGSGAQEERALCIVERLSLDPRHSLLLVRGREREHLILLGPDHALKIDSHAAAISDAGAAPTFIVPDAETLPS